jgi:sulfite reductase beta subunit-like hemoprotein
VSDTERLKYIMDETGLEEFTHVEKDRFEYAFDAALEEGREEPNDSDELEGFRRLIDAAIDKARGTK